jgi:hypothetical protein
VAASSPQTNAAIAQAAQHILQSSGGRNEEGSLNESTRTANKAKWTKIMVKQRVPTEAILARDEPKLVEPIISEPYAAAY